VKWKIKPSKSYPGFFMIEGPLPLTINPKHYSEAVDMIKDLNEVESYRRVFKKVEALFEGPLANSSYAGDILKDIRKLNT